MKKLESYEEEFLRIAAMYAKGNFSETISTDFDGGMKEIAEYVNALASNIEKEVDATLEEFGITVLSFFDNGFRVYLYSC